MIVFIFYRLLQAIPVLLVVGLVAFAMFTYVGDPVAAMLGQDYTEARRIALMHKLGLDRPFYEQFAHYIWAALHGNFGFSYRLAEPVATLFAQRLPATLELSFTATVFAVVLGGPMGVLCRHLAQILGLARVHAHQPGRGIAAHLPDRGAADPGVSRAQSAWLPSFGRGHVTQLGWWSTGFLTWSGIKALILPAITLGLFELTLIMRLVRAEMLDDAPTTLSSPARGACARAASISRTRCATRWCR